MSVYPRTPDLHGLLVQARVMKGLPTDDHARAYSCWSSVTCWANHPPAGKSGASCSAGCSVCSGGDQGHSSTMRVIASSITSAGITVWDSAIPRDGHAKMIVRSPGVGAGVNQ